MYQLKKTTPQINSKVWSSWFNKSWNFSSSISTEQNNFKRIIFHQEIATYVCNKEKEKFNEIKAHLEDQNKIKLINPLSEQTILVNNYWLTTITSTDYGFHLDKNNFRDSIGAHSKIALKYLPSR